jgi:hypothetical protein
MRGAGLTGASRRRKGVTTTRRDKDARPAPDLVDRDPDKLWVADITFVPTATVNDLATLLQNQVAGWPAYQSRVIRRGNASLAFGKVSVSTPLSSCALILSRSILFESVNPRV